MRRRRLMIGVIAAMLALPALALGRATTTVTVEAGGVNAYAPRTVTKTVGTGAVHWRWGTDGTTFAVHNVREDKKLFYSGRLTTSDPNGFAVVPSAGGFHYYCEIHGTRSGGMAGNVKVRPAIFNPKARSFGVRWSTGSNDTGNAFDIRYRVDGGKWKLWRNDVKTAQATFGANAKPIRVRPGHTYDVQARSEKASNPKKRSKWSPRARVST
jgi:plastocyanin